MHHVSLVSLAIFARRRSPSICSTPQVAFPYLTLQRSPPPHAVLRCAAGPSLRLSITFPSSPPQKNCRPAVVRRLPASAFVHCLSTALSIPWRYRQHPQALDSSPSSPFPPPVLLRPPFPSASSRPVTADGSACSRRRDSVSREKNE
jgi:hypothetical protein